MTKWTRILEDTYVKNEVYRKIWKNTLLLDVSCDSHLLNILHQRFIFKASSSESSQRKVFSFWLFCILQGIKLFFFFWGGEDEVELLRYLWAFQGTVLKAAMAAQSNLWYLLLSPCMFTAADIWKSLEIIWVSRLWNKPISDLNLAVKSLHWVNPAQNESTQMTETFGKPQKMGRHLQGEWLAQWCPFKKSPRNPYPHPYRNESFLFFKHLFIGL